MDKVTINLNDFDELRAAKEKLKEIKCVMEKIDIKYTESFLKSTGDFGGGLAYVNNSTRKMSDIIVSIKNICKRER